VLLRRRALPSPPRRRGRDALAARGARRSRRLRGCRRPRADARRADLAAPPAEHPLRRAGGSHRGDSYTPGRDGPGRLARVPLRHARGGRVRLHEPVRPGRRREGRAAGSGAGARPLRASDREADRAARPPARGRAELGHEPALRRLGRGAPTGPLPPRRHGRDGADLRAVRLSAIVPATDAPATLERCLAAIATADDPPEEVVVVDAADRPGPAAARNEGARRATGDALVFVDEDVELGLRLTASGARIALDPLLQGRHLKAWTLATMVRTDFARRGLPWAELLLERRGGSGALNLGRRHRLSALASLGLVGGILAHRPRLAAASAGVLLVLNRRFYAVLVRREGPMRGAAGLGLHAVHHLTGAAAAVTALARLGRSDRGRGSTRAR